MILDTNGWPMMPTIENAVMKVHTLNMTAAVGSLLEVDIRGFIFPGTEYKLVSPRCHLCFAPLVKEGSERERDLKTGVWIERATGTYSCGTTVVFEPEKKMLVTPGAKVRIGPKCVKLLRKK